AQVLPASPKADAPEAELNQQLRPQTRQKREEQEADQQPREEQVPAGSGEGQPRKKPLNPRDEQNGGNGERVMPHDETPAALQIEDERVLPRAVPPDAVAHGAPSDPVPPPQGTVRR